MGKRLKSSNRRRGAACGAVSLAFLFGLGIGLEAQNSGSKVNFSSERDEIALPDGDLNEKRLDSGLNLFRGKSSTSPALDIPLGSLSSPSSALKGSKLWDHYDKQNNWIFMNAKDLQKPLDPDEALGNKEGKWQSPDDKPESRMEQFLRGKKERSSQKESNSRSTTSVDGEFGSDKDLFGLSNQPSSSLEPNGLQRLSSNNFSFDRSQNDTEEKKFSIKFDKSGETSGFLNSGKVDFSSFGREDLQWGPSNRQYESMSGNFPWSQDKEKLSALDRIVGKQTSYHPLENPANERFWNPMAPDPTTREMNPIRGRSQDEFTIKSPGSVNFSSSTGSETAIGAFGRSSVLDDLGAAASQSEFNNGFNAAQPGSPSSSSFSPSVTSGNIFEWSTRKF